jgi:hypothetical protein
MNKYIKISSNAYKQLIEFERQYKIWNIDLFSPKGLDIIFGIKL